VCVFVCVCVCVCSNAVKYWICSQTEHGVTVKGQGGIVCSLCLKTSAIATQHKTLSALCVHVSGTKRKIEYTVCSRTFKLCISCYIQKVLFDPQIMYYFIKTLPILARHSSAKGGAACSMSKYDT